jgi:hypothetical protein
VIAALIVTGYHRLMDSRRTRCFLFPLLCLVLFATSLFAKDAPLQVIDWPDSGTPVLRFSFNKFKALPGMGSIHGYVMETTAQNLSNRVIPSARFSIYLFDKNKVRVGEDVIGVSNVGPGESVKFETTVAASGHPVSITLQEIKAQGKAVTMTVNSVPQGATLSVDEKEAGPTPRMINVGPGHHILRFSKEGFLAGTFPLEVGQNDVSGGQISYELGTPSYDSVELRDGTVVSGDLVSISGMDIEMRSGGELHHLDRNKVKRIMLVQRSAPAQDVPSAVAPQ